MRDTQQTKGRQRQTELSGFVDPDKAIADYDKQHPPDKKKEGEQEEEKEQEKEKPKTPEQQLIEARKREIREGLMAYAIDTDSDVFSLMESKLEQLKSIGRSWQNMEDVFRFLDGHAGWAMSTQKVSHSELSVPIRCRVVSALFSFTWVRAMAELEKVTDPDVLRDVEAWTRQLEAAYDAASARYYGDAYQYYEDVAGVPEIFDHLPPFLAR